METLIDNFGRIVIPKKVRDHFALRPGTHVRIEETDDTIILNHTLASPIWLIKMVCLFIPEPQQRILSNR